MKNKIEIKKVTQLWSDGLLTEIYKDDFDTKNFGNWRMKTPRGLVYSFRTKTRALEAFHMYIENKSLAFVKA